MARRAFAALLAAAFATSAMASCTAEAGGKYFDLTKGNNGNDCKVSMPSLGFDSIVNSCKAILSPIDNTCTSGTMACQVYQSPSTGSFKRMATHIASSSYDGATLKVHYEGGENCPSVGVDRKVIITYFCGTDSSTVPFFVNEYPSCTYNYEWTSPAGCALDSPPDNSGGGDDGGSGGGGGLSGGDVFLIIFFVGGFLYVAIGMAYNYKFKGQTGVEMVPNIEFWRGLPSLLKDGAVFAYQKTIGLCKSS